MIGSLLSAQILSHSVNRIRAATLPAAVKAQALAGVHANGAYYRPSAATGTHDTSIVQHALRASVASGTRIALLFAATIVVIGACLSFLIPRIPAPARRSADNLEPLEPLDVDPSLVGSR
jgi:hypothetical protein